MAGAPWDGVPRVTTPQPAAGGEVRGQEGVGHEAAHAVAHEVDRRARRRGVDRGRQPLDRRLEPGAASPAT